MIRFPGVRAAVPLVVSLLLPLAAAAQVVETPEGTVEFIGLERWTVDMIRDTMAAHAPGEPLGQCAAVLERIGFPSASSLHARSDEGETYVIVTVVEPQHAGRVQVGYSFSDSVPNRTEWQDALEIFRSHTGAFQRAIGQRGYFSRADSAMRAQMHGMRGTDSMHMRAYWDFLDAHRDPETLDLALRTLARDRNPMNRVIAATLLTNFPREDRAWRALLAAQRDPYDPVAATASQSLHALATMGERRVDWAPAIESIRALLLGTNVFTFTGTLDILRGTGIDPALAPALLEDGGADLLLAHLEARHRYARVPAHAFLVHLVGRDLGRDAGAWADWIRSLE